MPDIEISSQNYNGKTANVIFYSINNPLVGINIGTFTLPFVYSSEDCFGTYECYFPEYNNSVCQVVLYPIAWNISNIKTQGPVYTRSFSVSGQDTIPSGLFFSSDGLNMYVIGTTSDSIHQYLLGVAWDVSTASYIRSFSVSAQDINPQGLFFSPDGLNMYMIGSFGLSAYQYLLSVAWDVSTASYIRSFSVSGQDTNPQGLFFSSDGLNMYMIGASSDSAHQYLLGVAWDVSTSSYTRSFQEPSRDSVPTDIFFSSDGLKMYFIGTDRDSLAEYSLSSAWNISTSILTGIFRTAAAILPPIETQPNGLFFSSDGLNMYVIGGSIDSIHQYSLSSAWSIKTYDYHFNVVSRETFPCDLFFSSDGLNMYVIGQSTDSIHQYSLGVAWEISTAVYTRSFLIVFDNNSQGLFFSPDGFNMYIVGSSSDSIHQYLLSVAWDISTASYTRSFGVSGQDTGPIGLFFSPDGLNMYMIGSTSNSTYQYLLSVAWDISTASQIRSFNVSGQDSSAGALFFKPDGLNMYLIGRLNDSLYQYSLSAAWDIGSATYTSTSNRISRSENNPLGLYFKPDGLVLYTTGTVQRMVFQYQLTNN